MSRIAPKSDIARPTAEETALEWALRYASEGLRVLPLEPCGKRPLSRLVPHGVHDSSDDEATIRGWWRAEPAANVGLALPDDLVVVDVDPRNGGAEALAALCAEHGREWLDTLTCETGGGGQHYFLRAPLGTKPKLGAGLDLKRVGGYVVAAPSMHASGDVYRWRDWAVAPAWAPAWLVASPSKKAKALKAPPANDRDLTQNECEDLDKASAIIEPHYEPGQRNTLALAIGGWLRNAGMPPAAAEHLVGSLPSDAPDARVADSLRAWRVDKPAGWSELERLLPSDALSALSALRIMPSQKRSMLDTLKQRRTTATATAVVVVVESEPTHAGQDPQVDYVISQLASPEAGVFQRGGKLTIITRDAREDGSVIRPLGAPTIRDRERLRRREAQGGEPAQRLDDERPR